MKNEKHYKKKKNKTERIGFQQMVNFLGVCFVAHHNGTLHAFNLMIQVVASTSIANQTRKQNNR